MSENKYTLEDACRMIPDDGYAQWEASIGGCKLTDEAATDLSLRVLVLLTIKKISLAHESLIRATEEAEARKALKEIDEQQDLLMQLDPEHNFRGLLYMSSLALSDSRGAWSSFKKGESQTNRVKRIFARMKMYSRRWRV